MSQRNREIEKKPSLSSGKRKAACQRKKKAKKKAEQRAKWAQNLARCRSSGRVSGGQVENTHGTRHSPDENKFFSRDIIPEDFELLCEGGGVRPLKLTACAAVEWCFESAGKSALENNVENWRCLTPVGRF